jgi:hypothetical protein
VTASTPNEMLQSEALISISRPIAGLAAAGSRVNLFVHRGLLGSGCPLLGVGGCGYGSGGRVRRRRGRCHGRSGGVRGVAAAAAIVSC